MSTYVLSEQEIQNSIIEYLWFHNIMAWRNNTTGVYDPTTKVFRRLGKYERKGVPDILGILPNGKFLGIEVKKNEKSKVSKEQALFIEDASANFAVCFRAWSVEGVDKVLRNLEYVG